MLDFVYCNDLLILIYCAKLYNYFAFLNLKCWSLGIYTTIFKHFAAVNVFNIACAVWCNRNQWTFRHNTIITMDLAKAAALHVSSQISHEREKLTSNDALHNTCRSKKKKRIMIPQLDTTTAIVLFFHPSFEPKVVEAVVFR